MRHTNPPVDYLRDILTIEVREVWASWNMSSISHTLTRLSTACATVLVRRSPFLKKKRTFRSSELQVCQFGEVLNLGANRRRYISAALARCLTSRSNSLCPASATAPFCIESISTCIEKTSADSCKRKTIDHLDHLNLVLVCSVYAKVLKQVVRITRSRIHIKIHVKISLKTRAPKARAKKFQVSLSS